MIMNIMEKVIQGLTKIFNQSKNFFLLLLRIILAYGFFEPAIKKINHFDNIISWFRDGLHLPMPELMAFLTTTCEALGVVLLTLGLGTRFIALPLMVVMLVAIFLVHGTQVFAARDGGFEIPLYYFSMLSILLSQGPGRMSLDETFLKKYFASPRH